MKRMRRGTRSAPPKRLRVCMPMAALPADVWHVIASHLAPTELASLAATSRTLHSVAQPMLHSTLWRTLLGERAADDSPGALPALIAVLDSVPSLRTKRIARQVRLACAGTPEAPNPFSCFTVDQAAAFLGVDGMILVGGYRPARVSAARRAGKRGMLHPGFEPFPPDNPARTECPSRVFALPEVVRAARATHGSVSECVRWAQMALHRDWVRFDRAQRAERVVACMASEHGVDTREVEYALNASAAVTEFRRGLWTRGLEEYCVEVGLMMAVHSGLGGCYKCLLICDGNARLKAKRIVGKMLRTRSEFNVVHVVRALEGNLWWARSKSNVEKMAEMSRSMPKIRV